MWSFDRIVAGSAYSKDEVQPVLHRYNDAKYAWGDSAARMWLQGLIRSNSHRPVVIDLEVGTSSSCPIVLD